MSYVMLWYRKGPANYVGSLIDYVARGYSPALGRFISADAIVPRAGSSQALNRYMYAIGNPIRWSDPSGHYACDDDDCGKPIFRAIERALYIPKKLMEVRWDGLVDTRGLKADWLRLTAVWFAGTSPPDLGAWGTLKAGESVSQSPFIKEAVGLPYVVISRRDYVDDLVAKPSYQEALKEFAKNGFSRTEHVFTFSPDGSKSGSYNAVEWFLGSYHTVIEPIRIDEKTRTVHFRATVVNVSSWESESRLPQGFQERGLPPYLIGDSERKAGYPGGSFAQYFVWEGDVPLNEDFR